MNSNNSPVLPRTRPSDRSKEVINLGLLGALLGPLRFEASMASLVPRIFDPYQVLSWPGASAFSVCYFSL
jgi:hypothetical protein